MAARACGGLRQRVTNGAGSRPKGLLDSRLAEEAAGALKRGVRIDPSIACG
jgi:hypothetical protein